MIEGAESLVGTTMGGWRLERLLGMGGTGAVFAATQPDQESVALKVLLPPWQASAEDRAAFRARFLREARVMRELIHPALVPVLSAGQEGDFVYLTMPLLAGGTLARRVGHARDADALTWLSQVATGLDFAHANGVLHRDLKPANILLDGQDRAYLADFGILRLLTGEHITTLTATGQVIGTPAYMAPEQATGAVIGPAADYYSLGVVAFELLTGRPPFSAATPLELMLQHVRAAPPDPWTLRPDLPDGASAVLLAMLAKEPVERYASAAAFVADLQRGLAGEAVTLPNAPPPVVAPHPSELSDDAPTLSATGNQPTINATGSQPVLSATDNQPTLNATGNVATLSATGNVATLNATGNQPTLSATPSAKRRPWGRWWSLLALVTLLGGGSGVLLMARGHTPKAATATRNQATGTATTGERTPGLTATSATGSPVAVTVTSTATTGATIGGGAGGGGIAPTNTPAAPPTSTPHPATATATAPLAAGSAVYAVDQHQYSARRVNDGTAIWRTNPTQNTGARGPLALAGGVVYTTDDSVLYALNANSGGVVWQQAINASSSVSDQMAVSDGIGILDIDFNVTAFNLSDGSVRWRDSITSPVSNGNDAIISNGVVYIGQNNGSLYALDLFSGATKWSLALGHAIYAAPGVGDGLIFVATNTTSGAGLNAVAADGSHVVWSYAVGSFKSQPQVSGASVYFGDENGNVDALSASTGALLWQRGTGGEIIASPLLANGALYIGSTSNRFFALNPANGAVLWSVPTDANVTDQAAYGAGLVFYASYSTLYAARTSDGGAAWTVPAAGGTGTPIVGP